MCAARGQHNGSRGEDRLTTQLRDRVPLDLPYALGRDAPQFADIGELGLPTIDEAVTATHHVGGPLVQLVEQCFEPSVLLGVEEDLVGSGHRLTGNQVTERGVAAEATFQGPADSAALVDLLGATNTSTNDATLLRNTTADGLADPPGAVG